MTTPPDTPKPPAELWVSLNKRTGNVLMAGASKRSGDYRYILAPSPQGAHKLAEELERRITAYLVSGGLFNSELANHDAVRNLLIDCRDALAALRSSPSEQTSDARYQELIYAVARKWPGESRHDTALRYIREAEEVNKNNTVASSAIAASGEAG